MMDVVNMTRLRLSLTRAHFIDLISHYATTEMGVHVTRAQAGRLYDATKVEFELLDE